jgi:ABC-type ATPase with predicted acetyltransferase domain
MELNVAYDFLPKKRSVRTSYVMDHFGVDFDQGRHVVAEGVRLDPAPGQVVLFTGPSGSGKSSLLRAAARELEAAGLGVVWSEHLELPELPLVDALPRPLEETLDLLSACGLSEARLLLRTPGELSDGQRYRFRLALGLGQAIARGARFLAADEFTATLDRRLAQVIAFQLRRLADRRGVGFLLATAHEDIVEDLAPDWLVRCRLDGPVAVEHSPPGAGRPPGRRSVCFFASCGSARAPVPTGRTSLGGITAAATWASCGK